MCYYRQLLKEIKNRSVSQIYFELEKYFEKSEFDFSTFYYIPFFKISFQYLMQNTLTSQPNPFLA